MTIRPIGPVSSPRRLRIDSGKMLRKYVDPLDEDGAEDRAGDGPEPADDRHDEHLEAALDAVGLDAEHLLVVDEDRPGEGGDEARDREGGELGAHRVHAVGLGGALVLADRDQHAAGSAASQAAHGNDREQKAREGEVVEASLGGERDAAEQQRALEPFDGQPVHELAVEQVRRRRQRERERRRPRGTGRGCEAQGGR